MERHAPAQMRKIASTARAALVIVDAVVER
jgi:hypothetical protein